MRSCTNSPCATGYVGSTADGCVLIPSHRSHASLAGALLIAGAGPRTPWVRLCSRRRSGALAEDPLDDPDRLRKAGAFGGSKSAHETIERLDAHRPPARERAKALGGRPDPDDAAIARVARTPGDARALHLPDEAAHRGRADLFRRRELPERLRPAHEDGERGRLFGRDAGQRIRPAGTTEQMDRRRVEPVRQLAGRARGCGRSHGVILVSIAK